jgi:hypothetical protein
MLKVIYNYAKCVFKALVFERQKWGRARICPLKRDLQKFGQIYEKIKI